MADLGRADPIGPILWGHSGSLCHALSLLSSSSSLLWTSMHRQRATVATPGEWQCGVRRLAVANGPNIFQMLLVRYAIVALYKFICMYVSMGATAVLDIQCFNFHSIACCRSFLSLYVVYVCGPTSAGMIRRW